MKYWQLMGHYNGESQTFEAFAGTFQTSPFTPPLAGRLKGVRVIVGGEAATSLVENFQLRMSCTLWSPNIMHFCGNGNGLRTAPAMAQNIIDYEVDQPVQPQNQISLEGRHAVATAVTANILVMGLFDTAG